MAGWKLSGCPAPISCVIPADPGLLRSPVSSDGEVSSVWQKTVEFFAAAQEKKKKKVFRCGLNYNSPPFGDFSRHDTIILLLKVIIFLPFSGFVGKNCEIDVDACALPNSACPPGTLCLDLPGSLGYTCRVPCPQSLQVGEELNYQINHILVWQLCCGYRLQKLFFFLTPLMCISFISIIAMY